MRPLQQLKRLLRVNESQGTSSKTVFQPIPQVTPADVERVVRRDFTPDEYTTVTAMLNEYGVEQWQQESTRVRLAALKVANGSVQTLRACIDFSKARLPRRFGGCGISRLLQGWISSSGLVEEGAKPNR